MPNIPTFQYSSIPFQWHKQVAIKRLISSISGKNSETLNYAHPNQLLCLSIFYFLYHIFSSYPLFKVCCRIHD